MLLDQIHVDIHIEEGLSTKDNREIRKFVKSLDKKIKRMIELARVTERVGHIPIKIIVSR